MTAALLPITPDMELSSDAEREMIDYVVRRVMQHRQDYGEPADGVAIVTESAKGRTVHGFSIVSNSDRLGTCAAAAALLMHRATSD